MKYVLGDMTLCSLLDGCQKHNKSIFRTEELIFKMQTLHFVDTSAPMHKTKTHQIPQ
jgi:hypothetical protein